MDHLGFSYEFIILTIVIALAFDFMNGFHDAANSIATVVSTQVLRPQWAVAWAAFFNFVAFLCFGLHVAKTIGKGVIDPSVVDPVVIFAALNGALIWNIITWYFGIPSSSSHALIGGLAGAGVAKGGMKVLQSSGLTKAGVAIVISPLIGFVLAFIFMFLLSIFLFRSTPRRVDRWFRRLQLVSAGLYSLGHGGNDAQKTMGIMAALMISLHTLGAQSGAPEWLKLSPDAEIPLWVVLSCHAAIALGTLFGGWRIVKTMGMKITKLKPIGGFCAETGAAMMLFVANALGIPVSTTHTITGSIMGVGAVQKFSAVRWGVAERILVAWILTIPASAFVSAITWAICHQVLGG